MKTLVLILAVLAACSADESDKTKRGVLGLGYGGLGYPYGGYPYSGYNGYNGLGPYWSGLGLGHGHGLGLGYPYGGLSHLGAYSSPYLGYRNGLPLLR